MFFVFFFRLKFLLCCHERSISIIKGLQNTLDLGDMDASTRVMGLDAQGNMVFTVVKPVMGIFQVSSDQTGNAPQGVMGLQGLSENTLTVPQSQSQSQMDQNQAGGQPIQTHSQPQVPISLPGQTESLPQNQDLPPDPESPTQMPFAEVSSLLDPNMKGSKARKFV